MYMCTQPYVVCVHIVMMLIAIQWTTLGTAEYNQVTTLKAAIYVVLTVLWWQWVWCCSGDESAGDDPCDVKQGSSGSLSIPSNL